MSLILPILHSKLLMTTSRMGLEVESLGIPRLELCEGLRLGESPKILYLVSKGEQAAISTQRYGLDPYKDDLWSCPINQVNPKTTPQG